MANDILIDDDTKPTTTPSNGMSAKEQSLVTWVMDTLEPWRAWRDDNFVDLWDKYMRIYRGQHIDADKNRVKEKSKFIHPATKQAVDSIIAELEDVTLGKRQWLDLRDDVRDDQKEDMVYLRDLLLEDMEFAKVPKAIKETFLLGGIMGTGISKIIVTKEMVKVPKLVIDQNRQEVDRSVIEEEKVVVSLEAIYPHSFIIDPSCRSIDESLGVAHELLRPAHIVRRSQAKGVYFPHQFGDASELPSLDKMNYKRDISLKGKVVLTEYWGLVPADLLPDMDSDDKDLIEKFLDDGKSSSYMGGDNTEMIEAVVTIANGSTLLRAKANPYMFKDRPFISYQHSSLPHQFWGCGVAEAGYNVQVSLDAEMRTRQDAMSYTAHPMIAMNTQKMPRNQNPQVFAGKVWKVNGSVDEAIAPVRFGDVNPSTFSQSGELERLHQNAVGYQDSATPVGMSPRNATLGGMSMITTGSLKRIKTTLQNIERDYLSELAWKVAVRYMQYDPTRYPLADYRFKTISAMAMVAEEQEQAQLIQLLQIIPPEAPVLPLLIKSIVEKTSLSATPELAKVLDAWLQQTMAGPSQEEQQITNMVRKLGIEEKQLDNETAKAKIAKTVAETAAVKKNADVNSLNALTNSYESGNRVRVENERTDASRASGKKQRETKDV